MKQNYLKHLKISSSAIVIFIIVASAQVYGQTNRTFLLGHSLINFNVPNMINKLSIASGQTYSYQVNIGNGANLSYHYNNPTTGQGDQWNTTLPNGGFENFILTEAVPLQGHLTWSSTYRYADSFYAFAKNANPNIQMYLYETWHCTSSGNGSTSGVGGYPCDWDPESTTPWRQRLNNDLPKWESIADSVNLIHSRPMLVIPGGHALGRLADSIAAGGVPGLTSINNLFTDDIHLDMRGNYFIACVMYAVIHKVSPVGLPHQLTDEWGSNYTVFPTAAQAAKMQSIAWEAICAYNKDGVVCGGIALSIDSQNNTATNGSNTILQNSEPCNCDIFDVLGNFICSVKTTANAKLEIPMQVPQGLYIVKKKNKVYKMWQF
jgi:hypothetical protein